MATEVPTAEIPAAWKTQTHYTPQELLRTAKWAAKCEGLRFISWELRVSGNGVSLVVLGTRERDGRTVYAITTCAI